MRPKKDNEVKEAQLDPGYLSPRKMPWPDSISLIRESWISQLEFLVNTEAREYQDDGLDGEKGWLSFFFLPFFFLTKKKIDFSIQIIFFFWKNLSIFYILLFRWNFSKKRIFHYHNLTRVTSQSFPYFLLRIILLRKFIKSSTKFYPALDHSRNNLKKIKFFSILSSSLLSKKSAYLELTVVKFWLH